MSIIARARIHSIVSISIIGIVLFVSAGDLEWWPGWAYMVVLVLSTLLPLTGPFRLDEGLIEKYIGPFQAQNAKRLPNRIEASFLMNAHMGNYPVDLADDLSAAG